MNAEEVPAATVPERRKRPLAVWVIPIFDALFAGVFLITATFRFYGRPFFEGFEYPTWKVVLWGILGLGICISAHLAWFGSRLGRNALLALMTFYLVIWTVQDVSNLVWTVDVPQVQGSFVRQQIMEIVRSILWLAANYWFLLGRRARVFYS